MIEKKTVSLYLRKMINSIEGKVFSGNNGKYYLEASDVLPIIQNIDLIIQKEPLPDNLKQEKTQESSQNEDCIKKQIDGLAHRVYLLECRQLPATVEELKNVPL